MLYEVKATNNFIDPSQWRFVATTRYCDYPFQASFHPTDPDLVLIACAEPYAFLLYSTAQNSINLIQQLKTQTQAYGIQFSPIDGAIAVGVQLDGPVSLLSVSKQAINSIYNLTVQVSNLRNIAITPSGKYAAVVNYYDCEVLYISVQARTLNLLQTYTASETNYQCFGITYVNENIILIGGLDEISQYTITPSAMNIQTQPLHRQDISVCQISFMSGSNTTGAFAGTQFDSFYSFDYQYKGYKSRLIPATLLSFNIPYSISFNSNNIKAILGGYQNISLYIYRCKNQYCQTCAIDGQCITCINGYYSVGNSRNCSMKCNDGCLNCTNSTSCDSCTASNPPRIPDQFCACPLGYYSYGKQSQCILCQNSITGCNICGLSPVNPQKVICSTCLEGFQLQDNQCLCQGIICQPGYICYTELCWPCDASIKNCKSCTLNKRNFINCTACTNGLSVYNNQCSCSRENCLKGQACIKRQCTQCNTVISHCSVCSTIDGEPSGTTCTSCENNFQLKSTRCLCGVGFECKANEYCSDKDQCLLCNSIEASCINCLAVKNQTSNITCTNCSEWLRVKDGKCLCGDLDRPCLASALCIQDECQACSSIVPFCTRCHYSLNNSQSNSDNQAVQCSACSNGLNVYINTCLCGASGQQCRSQDICYREQCQACQSVIGHCSLCLTLDGTSEGTSCVSCENGFTLSGGRKCLCSGDICKDSEICYENLCSTCNKAIFRCTKCSSDESSQPFCEKCREGYELISNQCLCGGQTCSIQDQVCYQNECSLCDKVIPYCRSCITNDGQNIDCIECSQSFDLANNKCLCSGYQCSVQSVCLQGGCWPCKASVEHCIQCEIGDGDDVACTKCDLGWILEDNECRQQIQ